MNRGDLIFENSNGFATYQFKKNGQPMYLIKRNDGQDLWTNSIDIIKNFLKQKKNDNQLSLFH